MNILALASSGNNSSFRGLCRELHYHYYPRSQPQCRISCRHAGNHSQNFPGTLQIIIKIIIKT